MFTTFLKELGGYFDRRWLLAVFFPSLAFWSACLLVYGLVKGLSPLLELWGRQSGLMQVILIVAALSWVTFFAFLIGNFQTSIIRFFEGYWQTFPLTWLGKKRYHYYNRLLTHLKQRTENYKQQENALQEKLSSGVEQERQDAIQGLRDLRRVDREKLFLFPEEIDRVMPTRLGNIIRSAELYAWLRYGIDSVVLWPRLYALLPAEFTENLLGAKTSMTFMLVMSLLSFTFSLIVCTLLAIFTTNWLLFLFCALGWPLAWLCYRNSLGSALLYAELIKTAFDLHRWKLLEELHLKRPTNYQEETKTWEEVSYFVLRGYPLEIVEYDNVTQAPPADKSKPHLLRDIWRAVKNFFLEESKSGVPQSAGKIASHSQTGDPAKAASSLVPTSQAQLPSAPQVESPSPASTSPNPRPRDFFPICYFGLFLILFMPAILWTGLKRKPQIQVPVLAVEMPAYRLITKQALEIKTVAASNVSPSVLKDQNDLIGHYTLQTLAKGEMIRQEEIKTLKDPTLLDNTTAVAISATPAMLLGGSLKASDVVDITLVPDVSETQRTAPLTFENILVLDIKPLPAQGAAADSNAANPFLIIIALPTTRLQEFATGSAKAQFLVTRRS